MKKHYSIFSDGNYFPRAKKSGFGGYIEAPDGQIMVEFTEQIKDLKYAFSFELLGIIRGLQLAQSMGIQNVISYCDDKTTMQRLQDVFILEGDTSHLNKNNKPELFDQIVELSKGFENIDFQYIPRAQNKHSDSLSRRYSMLMEKNFVKQYKEELSFSEECFESEHKPNKRIFFSHPSLVKMKDKNNPFLVANLRNKKSRKASRSEQERDYQFLFIETIKYTEGTTQLQAFHYDNKDDSRQKTLISTQEFATPEDMTNDFCSFLNMALSKVAESDTKPVWIYSNLKNLNSFFEQKEKFPKEQFESYSTAYQAMSLFDRITFHALPFVHEFNPEIAIQEAKKKQLDTTIETVETLMEQLKTGALGREQNKYFGRLIRFQLRNSKELLARELNDMEKIAVIKQTTEELETVGLTNLPKMIKIKF